MSFQSDEGEDVEMATDLSPMMIEAFQVGVVNQPLSSVLCVLDWYFERVADEAVRIRASVTFDEEKNVVAAVIVPELD